MHQTDSVTVGLHQLLYGRQAPHLLLKRYENTDDELFHSLWSVPDTPETYLALSPAIQQRWQEHADAQRLGQWIASFYILPEKQFTPFHPLCKYYLSYIWCESRMIIQSAAVWTETLELTLLKYELAVLQQNLIELLKECSRRLDQGVSNEDEWTGRLERFMLNALRDHLLMLFYELQDRHAHLLEDRAVNREELWIKHLHRPVPEEPFCYRTEPYTEFYLEKALRGTGDLSCIEHLLKGAYREYEHSGDQTVRQALIPSIHRLENVWLCHWLCVEPGEMQPYELDDAEANRSRINKWLAELQQQGDEHRRDVLFRLPEIMEQGRAVIKTEYDYKASGAVRLLRELRQVFDPTAGSGGVKEGVPAYTTNNRQENGHGLLNDLISIDDIQRKLDVHLNTLNRYIRQSGIKVIEFSAKNRWMHKDDFEAFMEANKEKS